MTRTEIISAFAGLGQVIKCLGNSEVWPGYKVGVTEEEYNQLDGLVKAVKASNQWFTEDNVRKAFAAWGELLNEEGLTQWCSSYTFAETPKNIGIVMAGNIPLVGFHDLLSVLVSGHKAQVKLSSDDNQLLPALVKVLGNFNEELHHRVRFVERLEDFDAVLATGSNNTSRYFEAYFKHVPNVIRKNRTSVAIISEDVSEDELKKLGNDVFDYFGMGCRNVTKLYLQSGFDLDRIFKALYDFHPIMDMNKYANNYDYHKALFLMNREPFLENGFLILKESQSYYSPIGVLHYEFFQNEEAVRTELERDSDQIQCVVGTGVDFGSSQRPGLTDYADGVDTMEFLSKLS